MGAIDIGLSFSKEKSGPSWKWKVSRYENERYWPKWNSRLNVESILWTVNMLKVSTRKFVWRPDSETSADKVKWFTLNLRKKGNNTFFKSSRSSKVWSWELGCRILRNWREIYMVLRKYMAHVIGWKTRSSKNTRTTVQSLIINIFCFQSAVPNLCFIPYESYSMTKLMHWLIKKTELWMFLGNKCDWILF